VPSVKLAWYASARRAGSVPRSVFWPVPRVDSGLVAFTRHEAAGTHEAGGGENGRAGGVEDGRAGGRPRREDVFAVVDAAFAQRRKTLRAALATWAGTAAAAEQILRAAGVDPGLRGEALGVTEFTRIAACAQVARTIS
jgi:16S rRNA (adenine1518-N6/adenine1519-N6)-dimethyltransferase